MDNFGNTALVPLPHYLNLEPLQQNIYAKRNEQVHMNGPTCGVEGGGLVGPVEMHVPVCSGAGPGRARQRRAAQGHAHDHPQRHARYSSRRHAGGQA